jgi:hypothetical protein
MTRLIALSRVRPSGPRAGFSPGPSGGVPDSGNESRLETRKANGTPSASAAIWAPNTKKLPTTTSAGRRWSSARTSAAKRAAGPVIAPSRTRANAWNGVLASQSFMITLCGSRPARCGARSHGMCSAPVLATSGVSTRSASTRTSWPRSTIARITDVSAGTVPPPSTIANR